MPSVKIRGVLISRCSNGLKKRFQVDVSSTEDDSNPFLVQP